MIVAYSCTSTMSEKSDGKVDCICCYIYCMNVVDKIYKIDYWTYCSKQNLKRA